MGDLNSIMHVVLMLWWIGIQETSTQIYCPDHNLLSYTHLTEHS